MLYVVSLGSIPLAIFHALCVIEISWKPNLFAWFPSSIMMMMSRWQVSLGWVMLYMLLTLVSGVWDADGGDEKKVLHILFCLMVGQLAVTIVITLLYFIATRSMDPRLYRGDIVRLSD
jgi:hypothetical protein